MIKGMIFDLDGTLLDSIKIWEEVGFKYLLSLGIKPNDNLNDVIGDMSLVQSAQYFQSEYHVQYSVDEIIAGVNKIIEDYYVYEVLLKNGVKDFLENCYRKNIKLIIASATSKYLIEEALKRLKIRDYFIDILTCDEVGYGKDKPDIYNQALKYLGTRKDETLVFEDALYAIQTAKSVGFKVVGVYDKYEFLQEEVMKSSDYYVKELKEEFWL